MGNRVTWHHISPVTAAFESLTHRKCGSENQGHTEVEGRVGSAVGSLGLSTVLRSRVFPPPEETEFQSVKHLSNTHSQHVEEVDWTPNGLTASGTRAPDCIQNPRSRCEAPQACFRVVRKHGCSIYAAYWNRLEII